LTTRNVNGQNILSADGTVRLILGHINVSGNLLARSTSADPSKQASLKNIIPLDDTVRILCKYKNCAVTREVLSQIEDKLEQCQNILSGETPEGETSTEPGCIVFNESVGSFECTTGYENCISTCTTDADCPGGQCVVSSLGIGVCIDNCESDADCDEGKSCLGPFNLETVSFGKFCGNACPSGSDSECVNGFLCKGSSTIGTDVCVPRALIGE
jgi:hypothetical protein